MSLTAILMGIIGFLCGGIFTGLGIYSLHAKKPVSLWAGTKINPADVSDIGKFNRAVGIMFLIYSIPWWLAGVAGLLNDLGPAFAYLFLIILIIASSVGLWWLLNHYQKLYDEFVLDKKGDFC